MFSIFSLSIASEFLVSYQRDSDPHIFIFPVNCPQVFSIHFWGINLDMLKGSSEAKTALEEYHAA